MRERGEGRGGRGKRGEREGGEVDSVTLSLCHYVNENIKQVGKGGIMVRFKSSTLHQGYFILCPLEGAPHT